MAEKEGAAHGGGLLHSLRTLARTLLAAAQTRLDILVTEIEEARLRLEQLVLLALAAAFCLGMGVLLSVMFIVVYYWDTHRLESIAALAALFLALGAYVCWIVRDKAHAQRKPFASLRHELAKDHAELEDPPQ